MDDQEKSKEQLLEELKDLRRSVERFEMLGSIYQRIAEHAEYMVYRLRLPEGSYEYVSPAAAKITGYEPECWYAEPKLIHRIIRPDWKPRLKQEWEGILQGEAPSIHEYPIIHRSGEERWLHQRTVLSYDDKGKPIAMEGAISDITTHKYTEEALRESEAQYRMLTESIKDVVWIFDTETMYFTYVSPSVFNLRGYTAEEILKVPIDHALTPQVSHQLKELIRYRSAALRAGEISPDQFFTNEVEQPCRDGSTVWTEVITNYYLNEKTGHVEVRGVTRDIAERKQSEHDLKKEKAITDAILDSTPGIIYLFTADLHLIRWNRRHEVLTGYTTEELNHKYILDWVKGDEIGQKAILDGIARATKEGFGSAEVNIQGKDGRKIPMYLTACPLLMDGRPHFVGIGIDITDRRQTVAALRESERFSKEVQQIARLGGWKANPDTDYLEWTDIIFDIFEIPQEYQPGLAEGLSYFSADAIPILSNNLQRCITTGEPFVSECRAVTTPGKELWTEIRGLAHVTEEGRSYVVGTLQDITERKSVAQALEKAHSLLYTAIEHSLAGIVVADAPDGSISFANSAALGIRGQSVHPLTDIPIALHTERWNLFRPNGEPFLAEDLPLSQALLYGKVAQNEEAIIRRDSGEDRYILINASPVKDSKGNTIAAICVFPDITEHKQAETERIHLADQLRQAQKLESIGKLAGGIAHDFNNLLQVMLGNLDLIHDELPSESAIGEEIGEVHKAAQKAADLTRQLLAFGRRQVIQPVDTDVNVLILGIGKMLQRLLSERVTFKFIAAEKLPLICVDRGQCEQILINLCVNAQDAMPKGGKLTIKTETVFLTEEFCCKHNWAVKGRYVVIQVADTGEGMDENTCNRIFEPFFTTKELGHGTGLGLATVYGIVKQHNGLIHVESQLGEGSTFSVYFPVAETPSVETPPPPPPSIVGGTETLLIAEDEPAVLHLAAQMLSQAGYEVLTAPDGDKALQLFHEYADTIRLVLLDVIMPGLSGREAMEQMVITHPNMRFLFCSGYSESAIHNDFILHEGVQLVQKPYRREELLHQVRKALDTPVSGIMEKK